MPIYVYQCSGCGSRFEKRQSFSDAPLSRCESCSGQLHKVVQPTTVIFKGSGFYSTDYSSKSGGDGRNGNGSGKVEDAKPASDVAKESTKTPAAADGD